MGLGKEPGVVVVGGGLSGLAAAALLARQGMAGETHSRLSSGAGPRKGAATEAAMTEIRLREVLPGDLPVFFADQADPEATRLAAFPSRDREAFFEHWDRLLKEPTNLARTITLDGEVAGNIGSWNGEGQRLVGYWITRAFWGRGVATRALSAFLALEQTRPLHAHVAEHNRASRRVLQRCGFQEVSWERESGDVLDLLMVLR